MVPTDRTHLLACRRGEHYRIRAHVAWFVGLDWLARGHHQSGVTQLLCYSGRHPRLADIGSNSGDNSDERR
jgi:hypothetical protein